MGWNRQSVEFTICSCKSRKPRKRSGVAISSSSSSTSPCSSSSPSFSSRSPTRSLLDEHRIGGTIARATIYTCFFAVILTLLCASGTYAWPSSRGDDAGGPVRVVDEPTSSSGRVVEGGLVFQGDVAVAEEGEEAAPGGPRVSTFGSPLIATPMEPPAVGEQPILTADPPPRRVGGLTPQNANDLSIQEMANFAVKEHNKQRAENQQNEVSLIGILSAATQVVAGIMYHLTLEIGTDNGHEKFLAKVVEQAWMNSIQLVSFEKIPDAHGESHLRTTTADLGAHRGTRTPGRHPVSTEDPAVKQAIEHAERGIRARSNSLAPPEVKEVVSAEAEVADGTTFHLVLKVGISTADHIVKTSMHRTDDGHWRMKSMEIKKDAEEEVAGQ